MVTPAKAMQLGLGTRPGLERHIRPYRNGKDLTAQSRDRMVIDLLGLSADYVRTTFPDVYQYCLDAIKPQRDLNNRESYRSQWWVFGEPRRELRPALAGLGRYIATVETAKHRVFQFLDATIIPDNMLVVIASDNAADLAILSSKTHVVWATSVGGVLEDRPRYTKSACFDPFPFPDPNGVLKTKLRIAGEDLDAIRKHVLADHPALTLTGLYNVLEKIKAGASLAIDDEDVKQRGLILILKELHETIDRLTAEAYGWPPNLTDNQILEKLVALNAERAREEAAGRIRWLRPDYQIPRFAKGAAAKTGELDLGDTVVSIDTALPAFPSDRYDQVLSIEAMLRAAGRPMRAADLARAFKRGGRRIEARVNQVLVTLARYGRADALEDGRFVARKAA